MKHVLTVFLLTTLSSCCLLGPRRGRYPAVVSVLLLMRGAQSDVTIGRHDREVNFQGALMPSDDSRLVLHIQPKNITFSSKPTLNDCFNAAKAVVTANLSSDWSIDIANIDNVVAHCWKNGGWRSCLPGEEPFESHAFLLQKNGSVYSDFLSPEDPTAAAPLPQPTNVLFYVVVQSR